MLSLSVILGQSRSLALNQSRERLLFSLGEDTFNLDPRQGRVVRDTLFEQRLVDPYTMKTTLRATERAGQ